MIYGPDKKDVEALGVVYQENVFVGTMLPAFNWRFPWARYRHFITIKRWAGTDVLKCRLCWWYRWQAKICNWYISAHAFVSWELMDEFQKIFPNTIVITPPWSAEPEPYERKFNILVYSRRKRKGFGMDAEWLYGWDITAQLMAKYSDWNWILLDGTIKKNIVYELYHRADVLFRPTRHDGDPRMVKEAKMFKVPVVWNPEKMSLEYAEKKLAMIYWEWVIK